MTPLRPTHDSCNWPSPPRVRDTHEFYSGDLARLMNGRLRPAFRRIWFVGGGAVCGEWLRLGLADEVYYSIMPILMGNGIPYFEQLDHDVAMQPPALIVRPHQTRSRPTGVHEC